MTKSYSLPLLQSLPPAPPDLLCLSVKTDWWPASSVCPPQGQDRGGAGQAAGVQEGRHSSSSLWLSSSLPCGHSHGDSAWYAGQWPCHDMTHIITFSSHCHYAFRWSHNIFYQHMHLLCFQLMHSCHLTPVCDRWSSCPLLCIKNSRCRLFLQLGSGKNMHLKILTRLLKLMSLFRTTKILENVQNLQAI